MPFSAITLPGLIRLESEVNLSYPYPLFLCYEFSGIEDIDTVHYHTTAHTSSIISQI